MEKKKITKSALNTYLQSQGRTVDDLFGENSYFRYTKEGSDMLENGIEHFTGWKMGKGGLRIPSKEDPQAFLVHPKVQSMGDLANVEEYLGKINELIEDHEMHQVFIAKGFEAMYSNNQEKSIEAQAEAFLQKKGWSLEKLFDRKRSKKQRLELMNETLKHVSQSYMKGDGEIIAIDPEGGEHRAAKNPEFKLARVESKDHFLHLARGFKENRDLTFFLASPFVQQGKRITKESIEEILAERFDVSFEDIIEGKGLSEFERLKRMDSLHFFLTESKQDSDHDIVTTHPDSELKTVSFQNIPNKENYYESITTIDEFIEKAQIAREFRDNLYEQHERMRRLENKKEDREKGELERE